jgi:hypothetical protein
MARAYGMGNRACGNERSGGILNRTDILRTSSPSWWSGTCAICSAFAAAEISLMRGIEFDCEAARDFEAKLTPPLIDSFVKAGSHVAGRSIMYIKVQGFTCASKIGPRHDVSQVCPGDVFPAMRGP